MAAEQNRDPLTTALCEDLGLEFPIVAFSHCRDVVSAVSNAGGLGMLGAARYSPDELEEELRWLDDHAVRYGVDVLLPATAPDLSLDEEDVAIPAEHRHFVEQLREEAGVTPRPPGAAPNRPGFRDSLVAGPALAEQQIEVVLRHDIAAVGFGLGSSESLLAELHQRNIKVFGLVGSVRQAKRVAAQGVDYIVATGYDAGGHTGDVGTMSLVPQVVDAVAPVPVLAAGGIASGRQLAATLVMGAVGAWIGTLWLVSPESEIDPIVREKLIAAGDRDTVRTRAFTGKPSRRLRSAWSEAWEREGAPEILKYPQQGLLVRETAWRIADLKLADYMDTPAGQGVGLIKKSKPCRELVLDLVEEAADSLSRLGLQ